MRWYWIDRFTEVVIGQHAVAIKNVSLAEEQLHEHFPGHPVMPNSLVFEGIAQTGGLLVAQCSDFQERVILAKVAKSIFHFEAEPGDTLTYHARIELIREDGAMVSATSHVGDRLQAEADIFFAHLGDRDPGHTLFDASQLLTWLNVLRFFDVAKTPDGDRVPIPQSLTTSDGTE